MSEESPPIPPIPKMPPVPDVESPTGADEIFSTEPGEKSPNLEAEGKDRRKYPRVKFGAPSLSFDVLIKDFGPSMVYDMSFSGAALAQPKENPVGEDVKDLTVQLQMSGEAEPVGCELACKVIRASSSILALEFANVPAEARLLIDQVISDRVIGLNMNLIDPKHYNPSATFAYWFHGPKDTNLFIWEMESGGVSRAQFDIESATLVYENEAFHYDSKAEADFPQAIHPQAVLRKAVSILSQVQTNLEALTEFRKLLEQQIF